ncbi:MAG: RNA-directed DNA polymerase [Cytophagales bacterium]|nr:RNA-directed DNA polymerase [Armatimonadota bacterium]
MNAEQRTRFKELGKSAFIREEMTRLGYWPPSSEIANQSALAESKLKPLYEELIRVRKEFDTVSAEIAVSGDIPTLLAEVRKRRIERVRAERAVKKAEREQARSEAKTADAAWRRKTLPYLGVGVSGGLAYSDGDSAKISERALPSLTTAAQVAAAIGIGENELAFLCYERAVSGVDHYARFAIPKKKGGVRVLSSPKRRLRVAQSWLLKNVLEPLPVHSAAMAFRPGKSVVDNAAPHAGQAIVVKTDLKDFFPSLGLRRIKGLFEGLGYNEGVATLFALLATETPRIAVMFDGKRRFVAVSKQRGLPQGACTSPALTNLLCRNFDARLAGAAAAFGFRYTRYADDLTFSHASDKAPVGVLLALIRKIVADENLTVNEEKTQVLRLSDRQSITGLVVNGSETPRVSREDLRRFRAILHQCERDGFEAVTARLGKDAQAYAGGYLSFVHMARPDIAGKIAAAHPWLAKWRQANI